MQLLHLGQVTLIKILLGGSYLDLKTRMLYQVHQSHRDLNTSIHALLCNLWDPRENGVVTATMPGHGLRRPEAVHDAAVPEEEHQTELIFVSNLTEQTMDGMDADIYRVH